MIAKLGEPLKENQSGEYANLTYNGLSVHLKHGITFQLEAEEGYIGKTPDGVYVGMRWKDISAKYPELEFNGDLDFWFIPGIEGLGFDIASPRRRMRILLISVTCLRFTK